MCTFVDALVPDLQGFCHVRTWVWKLFEGKVDGARLIVQTQNVEHILHGLTVRLACAVEVGRIACGRILFPSVFGLYDHDLCFGLAVEAQRLGNF